MKFLNSQTCLTILGLLAVYYGIKCVAVAFKLWTPRSRKLTLDEKQLKGWRMLAALESAGMLCLWLGILLGLTAGVRCFVLAALGAVVFAVCKAILMKKYPYIDPATVKKSGKKKKK